MRILNHVMAEAIQRQDSLGQIAIERHREDGDLNRLISLPGNLAESGIHGRSRRGVSQFESIEFRHRLVAWRHAGEME
jgi:hypothetical protein